MSHPGKKPTEKPAGSADREGDEVEIDSQDSFPASDPPSFTPVVGDGKPPKDRKPSKPS
jgi:hypothetical protein